jgi:protein-disulfide isomerase
MERRAQIWMVGIFLAAIVAVTVFAALFGGSTPTQTFQGSTTVPITASDWTRGNAGAKVSVIEYGDFQCPACGAYEPMVQELERQYAQTVQFVFRNFPLPQHGNAMITAQAAEAAGLQGKYWEMHDLLYQKQAQWSDVSGGSIVADYLDSYALSLGLDVKKFNTDINSDAVKQKIQNDLASANAAQVDHTPTFFVNLTQIQNPQSVTAFQAVIDAALASSTSGR